MQSLNSPNHDERRAAISMLVLHYTGMETGAAAIERLCDPAAKVSAHYVVEEDGRVFQLVDEARRAWHAGLGAWRGCADINSASIGIEIVNGGHEFGLPEFPDVQMEAVIALSRDIVGRYAIKPWNVIGHSDMAPDRKSDPGERFDWARLAECGVSDWPTRPVALPSEAAPAALSKIGYHFDTDSAQSLSLVVTAFQRRFRPDQLNGRLDDETLGIIGAVQRAWAPG
ncbi:MAG: N-acetylmuramoyl-L-alanine amidase [Pseudomonadota bacterium]